MQSAIRIHLAMALVTFIQELVGELDSKQHSGKTSPEVDKDRVRSRQGKT